MKFYLKSDSIWQAIEADCQKASQSILIEQYILEDDEKGRKFVNILTEAVKRNVQVRLILDYIGSYTLKGSAVLKEFQAAGGQVLFDRPLWWIQALLPHTWFPRNHCKVMVIDEQTAYVGGACLASYMANWRETQAKVHGSLAKHIYDQSLSYWWQLYGGKKVRIPTPSPPDQPVQYVLQQPGRGRHPLRRILIAEIAKAKQHICIVSPYFFPPRWLRRALYRAKKRDVAITFLISEKTDVGISRIVTRAMLPHWLKRGFNVLFYEPVILHTKYAIIDDDWATVGSNNFDHLSLRYNREANLVIRDKEAIAALKGHFAVDKEHSRPATHDDWQKLSMIDKLIGTICRWIYRLL